MPGAGGGRASLRAGRGSSAVTGGSTRGGGDQRGASRRQRAVGADARPRAGTGSTGACRVAGSSVRAARRAAVLRGAGGAAGPRRRGLPVGGSLHRRLPRLPRSRHAPRAGGARGQLPQRRTRSPPSSATGRDRAGAHRPGNPSGAETVHASRAGRAGHGDPRARATVGAGPRTAGAIRRKPILHRGAPRFGGQPGRPAPGVASRHASGSRRRPLARRAHAAARCRRGGEDGQPRAPRRRLRHVRGRARRGAA